MTTFDAIVDALKRTNDLIAVTTRDRPQIIDITLTPATFAMFIESAPTTAIVSQPVGGPITVFHPRVTMIVRCGRGLA